MASLTAVGFFADRLKGGLERDARQLLGGDVIINSDQPAPAEFLDKALALGLRTSQQLSFPTMARARDEDGGASKLVAFKAVAAGYPLRGNLRVAEGPGLSAELTREIPAPGTVWVEAALLDALGLEMGQPLLLGDASLTRPRTRAGLTEIPEIFGAEQALLDRAVSAPVFDAAAGLVNRFKRYFLDQGLPVSENPSPGNIAGGITTLEEKSAGAVQKGSGTTAYAWFVWDKDAAGNTELKWFPPGYKALYR